MSAPVSHDYLHVHHDRNARRTGWVVALTLVMMVAEIVAGWLTRSMALLADGFHMGTHAGALGVAAFAYRFARAHADDPRFSFGTGKVGDLAGFASALVLALVSIGIALESAKRLVRPEAVDFADATLVAVIGLVVNLVSAGLLFDRHHHDHGHAHDHNLRAAYLHVLADALTSVLAIAALIGGRSLGWTWLDPAVGILGAAVIARWAWGLMTQTGAVLLDATDAATEARVRAAVGPETTIVDLHVWRLGPGALGVILDAAGPVDAVALRARVQALPGVRHVTVQVTSPLP